MILKILLICLAIVSLLTTHVVENIRVLISGICIYDL